MHALVRTVLRCRHPLSNTTTVNSISQTRRLSHVGTAEHEVWARCFHHFNLINNHHRRVSTMSSSEGENFDLGNVSGSESDDYAPAKKKPVNRARISRSIFTHISDNRPKRQRRRPQRRRSLHLNQLSREKQPPRRKFSRISTRMQTIASWMSITRTMNRGRPFSAKNLLLKGRRKLHLRLIPRFVASTLTFRPEFTVWQLSQIEHILKRPDSYIGSVETITQVMWTFDSDTKRMVHREVKYVPGFFKIIDEILVNAADNKVRLDGHAFVFPATHLFEDQRQKYGHA